MGAFVNNAFEANVRPSIGVAYSKRSLDLPGATVQLQIWDTAGSERFRSVSTLYYRGCSGAILVFDLSSSSSLESIDYWLDQVRTNGLPGLVVALVGNKCDLKQARQVSPEEAAAYAAEKGLLYVETSAKTGQGVQELFQQIGQEAVKQASSCNPGEELFKVVRTEKVSIDDIEAEEGGRGSGTARAGAGGRGDSDQGCKC